MSTAFLPAQRINHALTASAERRVLIWLAQRAPAWLTPDHLTLLGLLAQCGAGLSFALARYRRGALLLCIGCLILNWLGDSLDGTLARTRNQQRPRYGFYVDHMVDLLGTTALLCGLGCSGFLPWPIALAMLVAFLLLSAESFLATYTLGSFQLSTGPFGPTELRLLLIVGNLALLHNPYCTLFGHRMLLFGFGGTIGTLCMAVTVLQITIRHTAQLFHEEPKA